jgi:BirA family biotin operon repressor/biotin-[acetyl-CoA-carboxylase] ligase
MLPNVFTGLSFVERFYSYPDIESTNAKAVHLSQTPEQGIFVIQADRQSMGKGRYGKVFFSNTDGGLWVSIIQKLNDISTHFICNRALSLSILTTIKAHVPDAPLAIKWPNDIYWGNKKLCGILLETHNVQRNVLIIGFGLNVNIHLATFPPELQSIATSIQHEIGKNLSLHTLLRSIIETYKQFFDADQSIIHEHYSSFLYRSGARVKIDTIEGILKTVAPDGHAIIETSTGTARVNSGTMLFLD